MHYKLLTLAVAMLALQGCATKKYVHEYVADKLAPVESSIAAHADRAAADHKAQGEQIAGLNGRLTEANSRIADVSGRLAANEDGLASFVREQRGANQQLHSGLTAASKTAQDALDRAVAAGKLTAGKLIYDVVLSDDTLRFMPGKNDLTPPAQVVLDAFAANLKAQNTNLFVEIQGHTDNTGSTAYNHELAYQRAMAVRDYLAMKGGIPLHRLDVISYGETMPVADNKSRDGRKQNRRVVLVVLK
jgi:outer membrane protein OmpA-like peptidoglycan-associated protein